MNPRHFAKLFSLGTLVGCALAAAEGSYSNAPAANSGHDTPPARGGRATANSRVPKPNAATFQQNISKPQPSDSDPFGGEDPFAGVPDPSPKGVAPAKPAPFKVAAPPPVKGLGSRPPAPRKAPPLEQEPPAPPPLQVQQKPPAAAPPAPVEAVQPEPTEPMQPMDFGSRPAGPPQLVDAFSVEQNPGSGVLNYVHGGQTERIEFGAASGHFAFGMIFRGEYLPDQLGRDFKQKNVFQIALGTLRSRLQGQTPQFGALTILTDGMVDFSARYMLKMPTGQSSKPETGGLMLFTSPGTPVEQSDEEKLKSTYFAQAGTLNLTPEGKARVVDVKTQNRRLTYRMQLMRLEINGKLVTPFNATEAGLSGVLQFPIYYSEDRAGDMLAKQIARESFGSTAAITVVDDPDDTKRELASQKKKKHKKKKHKKRRRDDDDLEQDSSLE